MLSLIIILYEKETCGSARGQRMSYFFNSFRTELATKSIWVLEGRLYKPNMIGRETFHMSNPERRKLTCII